MKLLDKLWGQTEEGGVAESPSESEQEVATALDTSRSTWHLLESFERREPEWRKCLDEIRL